MENMELEYRIFTETTEDMGILYNSYKDIPKHIDEFLNVIEAAMKKVLPDPDHVKVNLTNEISEFKKKIAKQFKPSAIEISKIPTMKKTLKSCQTSMDSILNRLAKDKNKMAFGGKYLRWIINKPKVYSKNLDYQSYDNINGSIRNIARALDWVEKITIDLFNMIDQDINILTIIDKVYVSKGIYESVAVINDTNSFLQEGVSMEDDLDWVYDYLMEEGEVDAPPALANEPSTDSDEKKSMPKQTDSAESDKNGVRRKKLYIAFIEWCKAYNNKNTFGSIFDKDAFNVTYPFVPEEMRYFYRLANPILCVLGGQLTFFQVSELRKLNSENSKMNEMLIFAATPDDMRVFNVADKKVYRGTDENGTLTLQEVLGSTFDLYIQNMIKQGDILDGPIEDEE